LQAQPPKALPSPPLLLLLPLLDPEAAALPLVAATGCPLQLAPPRVAFVTLQAMGQVFPVEVAASHASGPQSVLRCMIGVKLLPPSVETPAVKASLYSSAQA